ncbi:MAG: S-layer homology domain-containing protein [Ruminococcaceae bacterium]|nr:S-layer homology domain-containing protein [Oscillospiraceae bacterium]
MEQALAGNLGRFSILKNSCATVALRAWNAAVGMKDGEKTDYYLEPAGTGIFAYIDAPKSVKDEIVNKLPGYYLNNSELVEEPNAGYQDETGWVYVSAPEVLNPKRMAARGIRNGAAKETGPYVGRLTIATRHFFEAQIVAHSLINFTTYEDLDLDVSCYRYYKPTDKYIALMEAYEDNPNAYPSDPALYSDEIPLEDRASYFELLDYGKRSEPRTVSLRAGEGITVSNYPHDADRLLTTLRTLDSSTIAETCMYTPILVSEMQYYEDNDAVNNGPLAFDTMMATLAQIYKETRETGVNPVTGTSDGGMDINREAYNQFVFDDIQASYTFYTVEITAEELESLKGYLADPENNEYGLMVMNCSTGVVDIWNSVLSDRPELQLTGNLTGFCAEPESIGIELCCLSTKTGKMFDGSGEGYGTHFYPRIEPAYKRPTPPEQSEPSCSDPVWDLSDPGNVTAAFYRTDDPSAPPYTAIATVTSVIAREPAPYRGGTVIYTATVRGPDGKIYTKTWSETLPNLSDGTSSGKDDWIYNSLIMGRRFNPLIKDDTDPVRIKDTSDIPFIDVAKTDPFYAAVKYVYDNNIMNGVSATKFDPYATLTRGMIVTILYRLEGEPAVAYSGTFTDVPSGEWYTDGVEWAAMTGIVNGYGNGKYRPTDPVTREQLAAILYRYADYKGYSVAIDENTNYLSYNDVFDIADYAKLPMFWSVENDMITDTDGDLNPSVPALRWEVAAAIRAFCENAAK